MEINEATFSYVTYPSPLGEITIAADDRGITEILFRDDGVPAVELNKPNSHLSAAVKQLKQYFAGNLQRFNLPLHPVGTTFQQSVWRQLLKVPYGQTASYGEIAGRLGTPSASRAVGTANGRNPIAIVIPCHRVIGSDGSLTGYAGGMERKQWLLAHEQKFTGKDFQLTG